MNLRSLIHLSFAGWLAVAMWPPAGLAEQETFRNPALEPQDDFQRAFTNGRVLARKGNFEDAINEFRKAAALRNGNCSECFEFIGQISLQTGRLKDAAEGYRQAIALKPQNEGELNNALGVSLYLQKDKKSLEEAVVAFNRAIQISGGKLVKAYYNLGYALIKLGREAEGIAALTRYLEVDPNSSSAAEVRSIIANPKLANERFAPGFKVKSTTGEQLSLEKLRGKVVMLDFWATWCRPCWVEMPEVKGIWKKYGGDRFVIIGVSLDYDLETLEHYVKKEEITWPQYFDEDGKLTRLYNVRGIPHTVLIDHNGMIRAVGYRASALGMKIDELVKKTLKPLEPGSQ
jgi:tetratricopeptide (TPR) repeat protein